jgi:hypothetical protein
MLFREGTGHWNDYSWGDYSFTCSDPAEPLSFWTVQEYATEDELWATWIAQIRPELKRVQGFYPKSNLILPSP